VPEILHFSPNVPVVLSIADPEGQWDQGIQQGTYQTTTGEIFVLPRPAVVTLNLLEARPGEEIQITRHWKGRTSDPVQWTICLTAKSERLRAVEEMAHPEAQEPPDFTAILQASIDQVESRKPLRGSPTLILKKPPRRAMYPAGTGTDGPALPEVVAQVAAFAAVMPKQPKPAVIPWNIAFREVSAWVAKELAGNNLQWGDDAQKSMVCTVLIAEVKAGRISTWERE
jgi:hypothetical protein